MGEAGTTGIFDGGGTTKYGAEGKKVTPYGGNEAIHDGVNSSGGRGNKVDETSAGFGE